MIRFRLGLRPVTHALLAALVVIIALPAVPALADDPVPEAPPSRLGSPEIFGYLTYWDLDAQIDYDAITTIAYFGLGAGADGKLMRRTSSGSYTTEYSRWQGAKVQRIIDEAHAHGVKFVLTVERMAWSDGTKAATRALLGSETARTTLVNEIVAEVVNRGLDGVTLDFEPILSDTRDQFAALLAELRAALDVVNPAYQLTFAATGSAPALTYQMYGNVTAAGWADAVLIMAYPLRGIDANIAGGLAPLYSPSSYDLKQVTKAYLQYVAPDKVVMLLPWYGREWPTETDGINARVQQDTTLYDRPRNIGYTLALPYAIEHGRRLDPIEMSAWTVFRWRYCDTCPETWKQIYYEDVETLGYKYDWALEQGLAGIGIWALGYDNDRPELWKLLRTKYGGLVDADPPTGSVAIAGYDGGCTPDRVRLTLAADDGAEGSGPVFVRVSSSPETDEAGLLGQATTYPSAPEISWPLPAMTAAQDNVYAQWRDVAGNWSSVVSLPFEREKPGEASVAIAPDGMSISSGVTVRVEHTGGRSISRVLVSNSAEMVDGVLSRATEGAPGTDINLNLTSVELGGTDGDGAHSVYAQWQDSLGCWSEPVAAEVILDREPPSGTLTLVDAPTLTTSGEVQVMALATDTTSGVATVELSNDGETWHPYPPGDGPISWSAAGLDDGQWTIHARWLDVAGNASPTQTVTLLLDRHGPTGTMTLDGGASFTAAETVTVQALATDSASDVEALRLANSSDTVDGVLSDGQDFAPGQPVSWALSGAGSATGVADGTHSVYAQWRDTAGNWSDVVAAQIVVDRTAPTATAPTTSLTSVTQLGTTTVPLAVSWSVSDDGGSGVTNAALEVAGDSGLWAAVPQLTSSASAVQLQADTRWRLRATAADRAGNLAAAESAPFVASVKQDSSAAVVYSGSWTRVRRSTASGGTVRYSKVKGATATLKFTGRSIAWVAPTGSGLGKAAVLINGRKVATVDLRGTGAQRQLVFTRNWAQSKSRTIKIKVLGTAGRPRVELDGFVVLT